MEEIGLPNAECGEQLNTIADPRSTKEVKRVAVAVMVKSLLGSTRDPTPRASNTPSAQATQVSPLKFNFGEPESGNTLPGLHLIQEDPSIPSPLRKEAIQNANLRSATAHQVRNWQQGQPFPTRCSSRHVCGHEFGVQRIPQEDSTAIPAAGGRVNRLQKRGLFNV
jgi:hypothetical protein